MASFPHLLPTNAAGTGDGPRVLWRLDHNATAEVFLYIVSPQQPELTHLVEQAGWPAAHTPDTPAWQSRPYAPFLDRLAAGSTWQFRLTANPVHQIRRKDGEPTKRTAHLTPVHQQGWLLDPKRQEHAGFQILEKAHEQRLLPGGTTHHNHTHHGDRYELTVRDERALSFAKSREDRSPAHRVKVVTVTFDGRLEVTDADALRRTLTQGLGKAKAYGCGLMTLAPVPTVSASGK